MNERLSHLDRYRAMAPVERNGELKRIYSLLPVNTVFENYPLPDRGRIIDGSSWDTAVAYAEAKEHRKNSQLRKELNMLVRALIIPFAETTKSFKLNFIENYDRYSINGRPEFNLDDYKFFEGSGIFDKVSAEPIDRASYRGFISLYEPSIPMREAIASIIEEGLGKHNTTDEIKLLEERWKDRPKLISQWREEFIQWYGDEP